MIAGGTVVAPVCATRMEDRSGRSETGADRRVWKSVGGPGMKVILSDFTVAASVRTSNTGSGYAVAPLRKQASQPDL